MIKNIAHIKFRGSNIGKFEHLHIENIKVKDTCVIETDEGIEIGHVLNFEDVDIDSLEEENNDNIDHSEETHHEDNIHDDYILEIFEKKDRRAAGPTAPAYGLYQYAAYYNNDNIAGLKGIPEKYRI